MIDKLDEIEIHSVFKPRFNLSMQCNPILFNYTISRISKQEHSLPNLGSRWKEASTFPARLQYIRNAPFRPVAKPNEHHR